MMTTLRAEDRLADLPPEVLNAAGVTQEHWKTICKNLEEEMEITTFGQLVGKKRGEIRINGGMTSFFLDKIQDVLDASGINFGLGAPQKRE
jgi:hypothetical protein